MKKNYPASLVFVTDFTSPPLDIEEAVLAPYGARLELSPDKTEEGLAARVGDADYVITQFAPVTAKVIGAMKKARLIVRYGIGVDNVDLQAAAARGIPVCNVPDYCTDEVADHTLALILAATRQVVPCANLVRTGVWKLAVPLQALRALRDMTVGVVGLGRIGREVVCRLKPFKCRLTGFDPAMTPEQVLAAGCEPVSMDELYARSDLITLHCPSTERTRYMINAESIARMKRGVILVNASRGTLVRTPDLVAALKSGHVSAAALDVTDPEPIEPDSPLLKMDNVVITSHIASATPEASKRLRTQVAETVARRIRGEPPVNVVNGVARAPAR
ncbi:MAG: C-terminal binding protein [Planctomycetota bacterium]|nr:C-terminal binding protein [Planctomycetota bacterium]